MIFGFYLAYIYKDFAFYCQLLVLFYAKTIGLLPYKISNIYINSKWILNLED